MAYGQNDSAKRTDYEKYKASLHAFFDGKAPLPERVRQMMSDNAAEEGASQSPCAPEPIISPPTSPHKKPRHYSSASGQKYTLLLQAIRSAEQDAIAAKVDDFIASGFEFPQDEDVLSKALVHPNQDIVSHILGQLQACLEQQPSRNPRLVKLRLENVRLMTSSPHLRERCDDVAKLLG